ncbi:MULTISPECIES: EAL domain-containing protein [unclassified Rhodanobacter]|uniref:putative bifunctional diguanylate cyclase/phosphodiesterase n=1 Tax=unclassified Rhodanobacter TaxID=2621553 RepID=UPI001BDFC42F|nr:MULTISPECIES: EAL domain-containing protein [unclassified Rhodanobacter]MBT2145005.1 EAL domain-containing protein [Rhodanobacter sp. LX-99]MBT2149050.1 EAL domain-containing protein [Rhodanobacter sp. LX-100]
MHSTGNSLQKPLTRRLLPLAYALAVAVALIMALTWGVLQVQVTLAGFLNSESVWSKAQKQAVIDLDNYALDGDAADLAGFQDHHGLLESDRWGRDAIISGDYSKEGITRVFERGNIMPAAQPGMTFMLRHFPGMPHIREALAAWRSTDASIAELGTIADELHAAYRAGGPSPAEIARQRGRIKALNAYMEPRTDLFSIEVVKGAVWLGELLFWAVLSAFLIAALLWLRMARRILESIRGSEERYRLLFDSAADAIVMVDEASGRILDVNRTAAVWTGRRADELVGDRFVHLFLQSMAGQQAGRAATNALLDADGHARPVETQTSLANWGNQRVRQAIIRDISERVAMERERQIAAEALANIAEGVIIADAGRRVISTNAAHTELTGFTSQSLHGKRLDDTRCLPNGKPLPQSIWDSVAAGHNWMGEVLSTRSDGSSYPEHLSISAIRDGEGQVVYYVAVLTDIHEAKANQHRLEHMARHDPLTGLVNRAEFERYCAEAIAVAERERLAVVVLFIDLDAFKIVNDSYSHAIGDRLLMKVAERIRRQLSEGDVAGRIGGDEFTVLIPRLILREDARAIVNRLLGTLSEPLLVDDYEIVLSASIGVAGYPLDGDNAAALIANADAAMYAAKTEERNAFRFYTPMMHADTRRRLQLATELRQALARNEFHLVFQPSVELRTGRIVAVEALVRWQHPERGEVLPAEFIPVAEGLGLIRRIDEWVMQATCAQIQAWDLAGVPPIRVAVNISARWFGHPAFVDGISRTLQSRHLSASRLMLEITESAMLRLGDDIERTMQTLHTLGIEVAIDDFGTGYSSMAYLKLPAVAYLKIDRSFVTGLPGDSNDAAITEAMLAMAKSLGLTTIAEGIETEAQHDFLLRSGCMEGQGYLYSYPLRPEEVQRLLCPNQPSVPARLKLVPPKRS